MKTFGKTTTAPYGPFGHSNLRDTPATMAQPNSPTVLYVLIFILTFMLGVVTTLLLTKSEQGAVVEPVAAVQPRPASLQELVMASLEQEQVTRTQTSDLLSPIHPIADVLSGLQPNASLIATPQPSPSQEEIEAEQALAEAAAAKAAAATAAAEEEQNAQRALGLHMRMLREGVLAGVYDVEVRNNDGKRQLVLRPINLELSRRFMKNLLRAAAKRGEITFPEELSTADGGVDLDTMLFNLVQNSLATDGTVEGARAAREMTRRVFVAAGIKTSDVKGDQSYTVEPGDSLAYISLKFYGRPGAYSRIFEANREILKSPDKIQIGQRLIIPG